MKKYNKHKSFNLYAFLVPIIAAAICIGVLNGSTFYPTYAPDYGNVSVETKAYAFRNEQLREEHYSKHGIEMGFEDAESYESAASKVASNPASLHKTEAEDGDDIYYLEQTNEIVFISTDGFIRTYFCPVSGKSYFDKQ